MPPRGHSSSSHSSRSSSSRSSSSRSSSRHSSSSRSSSRRSSSSYSNRRSDRYDRSYSSDYRGYRGSSGAPLVFLIILIIAAYMFYSYFKAKKLYSGSGTRSLETTENTNSNYDSRNNNYENDNSNYDSDGSDVSNIDLFGKVLYLDKIDENTYKIVTEADDYEKMLRWNNEYESYYDKESDCYLWYNTGILPNQWQYWYEGISSDYGDYGWMEYELDGWFIEERESEWYLLPDKYDTSKLWHLDMIPSDGSEEDTESALQNVEVVRPTGEKKD